jgi:hypothetical protein
MKNDLRFDENLFVDQANDRGIINNFGNYQRNTWFWVNMENRFK